MTVSFKNTGAPQNACVYLFLSLYASTTHTVTSQSSINNPYLLCLLEWDFIWSIWSAAGPLAACALSTCQAAAEAWKEVHRVVLNHRRILAVCLWEEKNGVNKLTKLIVEHFMMFPMMQSAVFRQCITQKSCDEWGPLHSCVMDFITLHKFPSLIFSPWCANNALPQPPHEYIKWTFTQLLLLIMPVCVCVWRWYNTLGANGLEAAWRTKEV